MKTLDSEEFRRAVAEFNEGRFFECHDTLEAIWIGTSGEERRFLQGLIQAAVGFYHFGNGNPSGALSQWGKARSKLEPFAPRHGGVELAELLDAVRAWSDAAVRMLSGEPAACADLPAPTIVFNLNSQRRDQWPQ